MFKGWLIDKIGDVQTVALTDLDEKDLPDGDVTVRVAYSTINYKEGLAFTGRSPVVRRFPMVPGVDFSGIVEESDHPGFAAGDEVILNGWGVGEVHWGGLAERASVKGEWLIKRPEALSMRQTMAIGTAGYTAMLAIMALERHGLTPASGELLVTGASGGVGSFALALLSTLGFRVVASTGKLAETEYLKSLGAAEIIDRAQFSLPGKPLARERWAGAIDSVGSHTLVNVCAGMKYRGAVAACGLAQGMDFPATVAPFILRGITLYGIDSVYRPIADRVAAWERLAALLDITKLDLITEERPLADAQAAAEAVLEGRIRGRVVINVAG
jgi:acrylyl-CoA reductase (NADPH)